MTGYDYEKYCVEYLQKTGYSRVRLTPKTGDQGVDIIGIKNGKKYGFQCKHYAQPVGNKAVQEVFAGATYYGCDKAVVITNTTFTKSAQDLAQRIGVELWGGISLDSEAHRKSKRESRKNGLILFLLLLLFCVIKFIFMAIEYYNLKFPTFLVLIIAFIYMIEKNKDIFQ